METQVRFLQALERDLIAVAEHERSRSASKGRKRKSWRGWAGAAASLLVLAFAVGAVAQLGQNERVVPAMGPLSAVGSASGEPAARFPAAAPFLGAQAPHQSKSVATRADVSADLTKIVRDGTIAVSIPDGSFGTKFAHVVAIAHIYGGFVLSSQTQGSTSGTLTIRVPAARFDAAMVRVGRLGDVESSSVTGKDVTNQYIDYEAHLQNFIGRRTVLRTLLARTTTIAESLTVENELEDVQLQIDQLQGQLRFLDDQVAESTLTVDLREQSVPAGETETNGGIDNPSLSRAFDRAIQGFFGILATIIVGLGYLLPLAVLGGLVLGVVTLVRRRGRAAS